MSRKLCSRRRSCQGNGFRFTTVVSLTKVGSRLAQTRPEQHCGWQRVSSKWKRRSGLTVLSDTYIWEKVVAYMVRLQVSPVHTCLRLFRIISDHLRIIYACMILSYDFSLRRFSALPGTLCLCPPATRLGAPICSYAWWGLAARSRWLAPCES